MSGHNLNLCEYCRLFINNLHFIVNICPMDIAMILQLCHFTLVIEKGLHHVVYNLVSVTQEGGECGSFQDFSRAPG